jgi:hypothetical protein
VASSMFDDDDIDDLLGDSGVSPAALPLPLPLPAHACSDLTMSLKSLTRLYAM